LKHQRSGQQSVVAGLTIFERSDLTRHGSMKLANSGSWWNGFTPLVKFEPVLGRYQKNVRTGQGSKLVLSLKPLGYHIEGCLLWNLAAGFTSCENGPLKP